MRANDSRSDVLSGQGFWSTNHGVRGGAERSDNDRDVRALTPLPAAAPFVAGRAHGSNVASNSSVVTTTIRRGMDGKSRISWRRNRWIPIRSSSSSSLSCCSAAEGSFLEAADRRWRLGGVEEAYAWPHRPPSQRTDAVGTGRRAEGVREGSRFGIAKAILPSAVRVVWHDRPGAII